MSDKSAVEITIYGSKYVLKGDSEPGYMQELGQVVDAKMRGLGLPPNAALHRVAILAALMLADELTKARRALEAERQRHDHAARTAAQLDLRLQELLTEAAVAAPAGPELHVEEPPEELEVNPPLGPPSGLFEEGS